MYKFYDGTIHTLNDVKEKFDDNYIKKIFDYAQNLDCIIYYEKINKLWITFIYSNDLSNNDYAKLI